MPLFPRNPLNSLVSGFVILLFLLLGLFCLHVVLLAIFYSPLTIFLFCLVAWGCASWTIHNPA